MRNRCIKNYNKLGGGRANKKGKDKNSKIFSTLIFDINTEAISLNLFYKQKDTGKQKQS